jgi:hypothetical protein
MRKFTGTDIQVIRSMAARGASAIEIGIELDRQPLAIRAKACALGIQLRPAKRVWHRLRILLEPQLNKALVLAARRRGMRAGELVRRLLTAILFHDLTDTILKAVAMQDQRANKAAFALTTGNTKMAQPKAVIIEQPQLQGCMQ